MNEERRVDVTLDLPFLGEPTRPERFGKYAVIRHLADGGMAEVYLARATGIEGFEKKAVIKRLKPELVQRFPMATELFLQEARIAATLEHPQIAQVYDAGVDDGSYYFAMEYVQGVDLRRLMAVAQKRQGQIRLEDALRIVTELCGALHYAHEKCGPDERPLGLVHRDVSPANVLVSYDGAVKLCDFGVAEVAAARDDPNRRLFAGKFGYISPEQCRAKTLDRRSDIFALSVVLYELTTLTRLFAGRSDREAVHKILSGKVRPPTQLRPKYLPELERIVMKGLSLDPADRYATAQEMRLELEAVGRERKLAMTAMGLSCLLRRLFPPELRQVEPYEVDLAFDGPAMVALPPRRRPYRLWLAAALLAGAMWAATYFVHPTAGPSGLPTRDLEAAAERIGARLDSSQRALETRARGLATTPMLRAALSTDAATMRDMVQHERLVTLGEGESLTIVQWRRDRPVVLLGLPEGSVHGPPPRGDARVVAVRDDRPGLDVTVAVELAPLYRERRLTGTLTMSAPVQVGELARELPAGPSRVIVRGAGGEVVLAEGTRAPPGLVRVVPVPRAPLELVVTCPAPAAGSSWLRVVRAGTLGAGLACAALFLIARRRFDRRAVTT